MKKFALQLPKQDFYSFKLRTLDKVLAVRLVDNNNDMPSPSQKFTERLALLAIEREAAERLDHQTVC